MTESSNSIDYFATSEESSPPKPKSTGGLVAFAGVTAITGGVVAVTVPFILPAFRRACLPYVPATSKQVENVVRVLGM